MGVLDATGDWVIHQGRLSPADAAAVRVSHPAFRYGLGLFESMLAVEGRLICTSEHLLRMKHSAQWLRLTGMPGSRAVHSGAHALYRARRSEGLSDAALRFTMVRLYLSPRSTDRPESEWTMTMESVPAGEIRSLARGAASGLSRWQQPTNHPLVAHKTLAYLDRFLTTRDARAAGHFDQVRLDEHDRVAEGSISSVFVVKRHELFATPVIGGILPGVTSARILRLARAERVVIHERAVHRDELAEADEIFLTNSTKGVVPVVEFDDRPVGRGKPGAVARRLQRLLDRDTAAQLG